MRSTPLAESGEEVEDKWSYIQDLTEAWQARLQEVRTARSGGLARRGRRGRRCRDAEPAGSWMRIGRRLALHIPAGHAHRARGADVRFQDAARDGRAVYAGVQADPLVARAAGRLAAAGASMRVLARAAMNGESTDGTTWVAMFPTLFGDAVRRRRAAGRPRCALEVAERGEAVRSQVRGAMVEELTARLLARRVPAAAAGVNDASSSMACDGVPTTSRWNAMAPRRRDCEVGAQGIGDDVLYQLDDARTNAADEDVELRVALVVFDARRSCDVRLARWTTAPTAGTRVALEELDELAAGG